jgi:sec-independent protein translocase protein TatA
MELSVLLGVVGPWQIVVILFIVVLLFGGRKIPELMKGIGQGIKEFKKASKDINDEVNNISTDDKVVEKK